MKAQDLFPYNSTIVGLNNIYHIIGCNSFYINSSCILATDKIATKGKEYIIFDNATDAGIRMTEVILVDCFYRDGVINLIVQDIRSQRVFIIDHCIECYDCTWVLIDLHFFVDKMNAEAIQSYCGNCDDPQKKPNAESKNGSSHDDLLEFEF